jgi:hypothetical protein
MILWYPSGLGPSIFKPRFTLAGAISVTRSTGPLSKVDEACQFCSYLGSNQDIWIGGIPSKHIQIKEFKEERATAGLALTLGHETDTFSNVPHHL